MDTLDAINQAFDLLAGFGGGGSSSGGGSAGGGFSDGGGSSGDGSGEFSLGGFLLMLVAIGVGMVLRRFRSRQASDVRFDTPATSEELLVEQRWWQQLQVRAPGWGEQQTEDYVERAFRSLNDAWSRNDPDAMREWLTPRMHDKMSAMLAGLELMGRRNVVTGIDVRSMVLDDVSGADEAPAFTLRIGAATSDVVVDEATGMTLADSGGVFERWRFVSDGSSWRLDDIIQPTRERSFDVAGIEAFAAAHGLHYSADFGRLLLPERGVLFGGASLTVSDVNNHVIGWMGDALVQLYTFVRNPRGNPGDQQVIAQVALPRSHDDIFVCRRGRTRLVPSVLGLTERTVEGVDFHRAWQVYSTDADEIATFELLNPAFMERLAAIDHRLGIEAVGRNVFLFDEDGTASYDLMFDLLLQAHRELRL